MVALILLAAAALGLGLAASSSTTTAQPTPADACRYTAANVPLQGALLTAWLRCAGRTATEVRALTDRLQAGGDAAGAQAIADRWQQIRTAEPSPTDAAARAALAATDVEAARPEFVSTMPVQAPPPERRDAAPADRPAGGEDVSPALRQAATAAVRAVRAGVSNGRAPRTRIAAVLAFQRLVPGLEPDGLYGPDTRVALAFYTGVATSSLPAAAFPGSITWSPDSAPQRAEAPAADHGPAEAAFAASQAPQGAPEGAPADRPALPPGANADSARRLAGPLSRRLRGARPGAYRDEIRAFQRAAGLTADGMYGGTTANALRYFGIAESAIPAPHQAPQRDEPRAAYPPRS